MHAGLLDRATRGARLAMPAALALAAGAVVGASALTGGATTLVTVSGASTSVAPTGGAHAAARRSDKADEQVAKAHDTTQKAEDKGADKADEAADRADEKVDKAEEKADKAEGKADSGGVHGSCVSAVARDKGAVGGPHHNHGFAVSRAAHTCPNPRPGGSAGG